MRRLPIVLFALAFASSAHAATAVMDSAQAVAKARDLRAAFNLSNTDALWRSFDDRMKGAMGDKEKFAGVLEKILGTTGRAFDCPSEVASRAEGLWVVDSKCKFEKAEAPLNMEFSFNDDGSVAGFWIKPDAQPFPTTHENDSTRTVLHLPFYGTWTVFWGGKKIEDNYHVIARDQRFAYDIVKTENKSSHKTDGKANEDYYCWLQPIVAPAAGTVTMAVDGVADNTPGSMNPMQKAGNHVLIDHGNGEFSMFAHFHRGSVRVKPGQVVAAGDTLGLCGNSGNSSEPHLHYHLQNGPAFGDADGIPAYFVDYVADDKPVARGIPVRGQKIRRAQ
jgi:hypothetical protein